MLQQTIKNSFTVSGIGLHTGKPCTIKLNPAPENFGVRFFRIDIDIEKKIPAEIAYVKSTFRATTIGANDITIQTVEHLLAALFSKGIDNVKIELSGPEVPILNGDALSYINLINEAGIEIQTLGADCFSIDESVQIKSQDGLSELMVFPSDRLEISCLVDFDDDVLGQQFANMSDLDSFESDISAARTFVFVDELAELFKSGISQGGDLSNAVILPAKNKDFKLESLSDVLDGEKTRQIIEYMQQPVSLLFPDEPARHKLLDFLGDLALLGKRIKGKFIIKRPGHKVNVEFVQQLKQLHVAQKRLKGKPKYDPNIEPVHDLVSIQNLLPHRYPFLLVDKIIEMSESRVVGIKNITFNENFFMGHFPGNPIFPGVLQMEALAQTGGILALSGVEKPEEWGTYFLKMDKVKFKYKVSPGDTLILKMELLTPIRRGIVHMQGTAYVGNRIVSEGELTAQIVHLRKPVDE